MLEITLKPVRCRECNELYMGEPHEEKVCSKCIGNFTQKPDNERNEKWTLVKLGNDKYHVVSTTGRLIKIDEIIEAENNC